MRPPTLTKTSRTRISIWRSTCSASPEVISRAAALLMAGAVALSSCFPADRSSQTSPSPSAARTTVRPTATASPSVAYSESELADLRNAPTSLAISATHVYLAENDVGARPLDVRARALRVPLGGGALEVVPGSETQPGTAVSGLGYKGDLHLSLAAEGRSSHSGVFRSSGGQLVAVVGGGGPPASGNGDGGQALAASLQQPQDLAFGRGDLLYIADASDSRVRVVRAGVITTYAGNGTCLGRQPESGPATATPLCAPGLLAIDPAGALYVAQRTGANWIARVDANGQLTVVVTAFAVGGIAVDAQGQLLALDAAMGRILRYSSLATPPVTVASNLGLARGLAVDADGSIYTARSKTPNPGTARSWHLLRLSPRP